jgi:hypothetical protein
MSVRSYDIYISESGLFPAEQCSLVPSIVNVFNQFEEFPIYFSFADGLCN